MKILSFLTSLMFVFLIACGGGSDSSSEESNGPDPIPPVPPENGFLVQVSSSMGVNAASTEDCRSVTRDLEGNIYCAGHTRGNFSGSAGGFADAVILKFNSEGVLQWASHIGSDVTVPGGDTSGYDYCESVAVDDSGNVYCGGRTRSDLGETNAGGDDVFVLKLDSSGVLQWITQLGDVTATTGGDASAWDQANAIKIDSLGNVIIAGRFSDGSSVGEAEGGDNDAFVAKFNSSGAVVWIKQLGSVTTVPGGDTSKADVCLDLALDSSDNIYCAGETIGSLGEANGGSGDAFVMKLSTAGAIEWITQIGSQTGSGSYDSSGIDKCKGVAVDASGDIYCAGSTRSDLSETNGGTDGGAFNNDDAFVMKLNSLGALQWIKQLGSETIQSSNDAEGTDSCTSVAVDSTDGVYCAGQTNSSLGEMNAGSFDVFVAKFRKNDGALEYLNQLGSDTEVPGTDKTQTDFLSAITVDDIGNVFGAGSTSGTLGAQRGGQTDIFIIKFNVNGELNLPE